MSNRHKLLEAVRLSRPIEEHFPKVVMVVAASVNGHAVPMPKVTAAPSQTVVASLKQAA